MNRKIHQILALALLIVAPMVMGQDWMVPESESGKLNPSDYTLENVKRGKEVYTRNCKSCHGDPGKNNPLTLVPMPVDIASEKMQTNSEGGLYYKITIGKGVMPPFETTISESDRWNLVHFIMNYNPDREQLLVDAPPVKAKLLASVNEEKAQLWRYWPNSRTRMPGIQAWPMHLFMVSSRKAFGNIEIGQAITNEYGRAEFIIPEDVIGDEEGYMTIVVSLDENYDRPGSGT